MHVILLIVFVYRSVQLIVFFIIVLQLYIINSFDFTNIYVCNVRTYNLLCIAAVTVSTVRTSQGNGASQLRHLAPASAQSLRAASRWEGDPACSVTVRGRQCHNWRLCGGQSVVVALLL